MHGRRQNYIPPNSSGDNNHMVITSLEEIWPGLKILSVPVSVTMFEYKL